jgi:hypothetical protein
VQPESLWERACPRRRRQVQDHHCLTHRFREQARSHRFVAGLSKGLPLDARSVR